MLSKIKIKELLNETSKNKRLADKYTNLYNQNRVELQKYFDNTTSNQIGNDDIVVTKRERINIIYNIYKLREKLDKNIFKKVTNRRYYVKDLDGLVELMKQAGIKPKDFKKYVDADISVDKSQIKKLYEAGEISISDLEGCFHATITKYIDVREIRETGDKN